MLLVIMWMLTFKFIHLEFDGHLKLPPQIYLSAIQLHIELLF